VGYELSISKTFVEDKIIRECLETPSQLVPFAVMEVSYMLNAGFMSRGQLIADVGKLSSLERVCISHGRSDFVCQPVSAYRLSEALGKLKVPCDLDFVAAAGHSDTEPGLVSSMVTHSDGIRDLLAK
jgi:proline iminopeptidase